MRKLLVFAGAALAVFMAITSTAAAHNGSSSAFTCDGVFTSLTVQNVEVPRDKACTLTDSTVSGHVRVFRNAYFQATNTDIAGDVSADNAQTLFIDGGSTVAGSVRAFGTAQVFAFDSTVTGRIEVSRAQQVNICGNTVLQDDIKVNRSTRDVLIGDPLAVGCAGNTVSHGDIQVYDNNVDVELTVRGNTVFDDLELIGNSGPAAKFVQDNTGGDDLKCYRNSQPFTASGNTGFESQQGQCEQVFECDGAFTGVTTDRVEVGRDHLCTLTDSTVSGSVRVRSNAYFQATNTDIAGDVSADNAQTLFIDGGSTVAGSVRAFGTAQVFAFDSTVTGRIEVSRAQQVNICGNTVLQDDIKVNRSTRDVLVGDPLAVGCAGNTVSHGDIEVEDNNVDVELVVRGNTVFDDIELIGNSGPAAKFVQDNTGADDLKCYRNSQPFTASGNTGFESQQGQCAEGI